MSKTVSAMPLATQARAYARVDQASIVQDCFNAVLKLGHPQSPADFAHTYAALRATLDRLLQQPGAWGLNDSDAQDIAYAVVALADEMALKASPELAQFWLPRRLQMLYFDDNMAGEGFFQRLEALRHEPSRHGILQAYYVALALGFEGRYGRQEGAHEIMALMASVHQTLVSHAAKHGSALSAHGEPHDAPAALAQWWQRPAAQLGGLAGLFALAYAAMSLSLYARSQGIALAAERLFTRIGG